MLPMASNIKKKGLPLRSDNSLVAVRCFMKNIKGILFALVSSGTFGLIPLFSIALIKNGMGLPSILFYRFLFSALMMGAVCLIQGKSFCISGKELRTVFILTLFYAATALGLLYSYLYLPSGVATTIHFLYPVVVTIIMIVFFKEQKSVVVIVAALLSFLGVGFLTWSGGSVLNPIGIALVLGIVVTYAIYIVGLNTSSVAKTDSQVLTFYILLFTALILGIYAATVTGIDGIQTTSNWINLLLLALLPTVVSNLTLVLAIKYAGPTTTSILGSMEPLVAVFIGIVFMNEDFGVFSFIGLAIVISSVALVVFADRKKNIPTIE